MNDDIYDFYHDDDDDVDDDFFFLVRTLTHSPVALLQYRHSKKKHGK